MTTRSRHCSAHYCGIEDTVSWLFNGEELKYRVHSRLFGHEACPSCLTLILSVEKLCGQKISNALGTVLHWTCENFNSVPHGSVYYTYPLLAMSCKNRQRYIIMTYYLITYDVVTYYHVITLRYTVTFRWCQYDCLTDNTPFIIAKNASNRNIEKIFIFDYFLAFMYQLEANLSKLWKEMSDWDQRKTTLAHITIVEQRQVKMDRYNVMSWRSCCLLMV